MQGEGRGEERTSREGEQGRGQRGHLQEEMLVGSRDLLPSPTTALQGSQQPWLHPGITWEAWGLRFFPGAPRESTLHWFSKWGSHAASPGSGNADSQALPRAVSATPSFPGMLMLGGGWAGPPPVVCNGWGGPPRARCSQEEEKRQGRGRAVGVQAGRVLLHPGGVVGLRPEAAGAPSPPGSQAAKGREVLGCLGTCSG